MKNKLSLAVILLLIAGITAAVFYSRKVRREIDETNARIEARNGNAEAAGPADGIGSMSITGMEIVQGEQGRESWRLKAQDALMSEQGGDIIAQRPYLTYYFSPGEDKPGVGREVLFVESDTGDVNQQANRIRFVGNVVARYKDDVLTTSLLVYDGRNNRLDCPGESHIKSDNMTGRASRMSWHLDDNTLHASGGVSLDIETAPAAMPAGINK